MKTRTLRTFAPPAALALAAALFQPACGTTVGNPQSPATVNLNLGSYTPLVDFWSSFFGIPFVTPAYAAVSSLKLCFKRVRFKATSTSGEGNIDFSVGEVNVMSGGGSLGKTSVPAGTYGRIEFDITTDCPSGLSIQLTNDNGSFSTTDGATVRFDGSVTIAGGASQAITLGIQSIITQLNTVTVSTDLKNKAEAAGGSF